MSNIQNQRNVLQKRFRDKAVVRIDDALYSSHQLLPNWTNRRLFPVHDQAVERLNSTMQREIDGNAQIFYTMIYKDQPREDLIKEFWNGLITQPEFQALPRPLQELELEQAKKLGPTSRFTIDKLFDGFISHVDEEAKTRNQNLSDYEKAADVFTSYLFKVCVYAIQLQPELLKYVENLGKVDTDALLHSLPKDKAGGDPYFIRTDRKVAGTTANELYLRDSRVVKTYTQKAMYYTMYLRVQNKGNNIVQGIEPVEEIPDEAWLPEKNRVVQGDSRSWQFILKPYSDIVTKIPKTIDPIFVGWCDQERKNDIMGATLGHFYNRVNFDSFDATEYDASTDPENFALGIRIILRLAGRLAKYYGIKYDPVDEDHVIDHYLHDPTLTPWGAFFRDSTPSGHNFTGPNGTVTNLLRCLVQEARRRGVSVQTLCDYMLDIIYTSRGQTKIALFSAVGDDAFQLRSRSRDEASIAEENNLDGFTSNRDKILLSKHMIHFLQFAYYRDGDVCLLGYYPISRVMEHALFQEVADQYSAESVSAQAVVQNLNNARYNPLLPYGVAFLMKGDVKYRLGYKTGVMRLFKAAAKGQEPAEFLNRSWDPAYANMTWEKYGEVLKPVISAIEAEGRKSNY